jgi:hypothetical protein
MAMPGTHSATLFRIGVPPITAEGVIMCCLQLLFANAELVNKTIQNIRRGDYDILLHRFERSLALYFTWHMRDEGPAFRRERHPEREAAESSLAAPSDVVNLILGLRKTDRGIVVQALRHEPEHVDFRVRYLLKTLWHWQRLRFLNPERLWDSEYEELVAHKFGGTFLRAMKQEPQDLQEPEHDDSD